MEKFLIVLGSEILKFTQYFLLLVIGLFVGFLYTLKTIKNENFKNKTEKLLYVVQSIGSSMLITWISYEIANYFFNLPTSLCVAISGGVGYLGGESTSALVLDILKKRV